MRARDKLHTMELGGDGSIQTYLLGNFREARMEALCLGSAATVWLTPAKLRRLAKRLIWCADQIEKGGS